MEPFEKAFDQLRRDYLAESGTRIDEFRQDVDALRAGNADALGSLRTRFHRLVGSGGSYGFPEISSAAREAERRLSAQPDSDPVDPDAIEDLVNRLAVLFSEAERMVRAASGPGSARLAVLAMDDGVLAADLNEILTSAGFTVRLVPPDAKPQDVAMAEATQLAVLAHTGPESYIAAAAWSAEAASSPRSVVLVEDAIEADRLRAAVSGVEFVLPADRVASELARLAQRLVLTSAARFVAVLADDNVARGDKLAAALNAAGIEVRRAADPDAAAQHLELAVPDLFIASAALPNGGGRALARLVRQDARSVAVPVVLMGALSEEDRLAALREGVDEVLTGAREARLMAAELRARSERARRVRELIRRDPLTGALSDPALRAELDHAVVMARRDDRPLAFLMLIVEGVREINVAHGLAVGDRLLAHAAAVMRTTLRQSDIVGRRGGRAFAAVLRGSGADGAQRIVAKLQSAFEEHPYELRDGTTIPLLVSVTAAELGGDVVTTEDLLRAASRM